jgi:NAD(P)-dependent dehydrogenase (short-subunit alcohol dehydrogenase family)
MADRTRGALIVGGSGGLGRAIAERLGADGWTIGLAARDTRRLDAARRGLIEAGATVGGAWSVDARDGAELARVCGEFAARAGSLDALVFAAGRLAGLGPLEATDLEAAWSDVEIVLKGFAHVVRAAVPELRRSRGGSIQVLVGPGYNGELAHAALYSAAQAGLARLVESLGRELEGSGVGVYGVYPGVTPTPFMQGLIDGPAGRRWLPRFNEMFAEGKEVGPGVAAEMVAWLAAERPMGLSGRVIPALQTPELLATRLGRYDADSELGRLRLR